jgi:hypothetical protein
MRPETPALRSHQLPVRGLGRCTVSALIVMVALIFPRNGIAQDDLSKRVQQLSEAMVRVQHQIEDSQRQLKDLQQQLAAIQREAGNTQSAALSEADSSAAQLTAAVDELRERQSVLESQAATQEQEKVESASKYPVKLSGMILMNGFVDTAKVDSAPTPSAALGGAGTTGATVRQTILGFDIRGPHLFGATSRADLRLDFDASVSSGSTYGADAFGLARLRTAHAELDWEHTSAFFSLDKPLINLQTPDSITAVAVPSLAWSGNLWTWNPQLGIRHDLEYGSSGHVRAQAALIAVTDPPALFASSPSPSYTPPSTAEQSRWPGVEATLDLLSGQTARGLLLGVGGIFAPHRASTLGRFDSWAGTFNFAVPLGQRIRFSGSAYRGLGLGGLGGGGYKDFVYRTTATDTYFRALDDFGGWGQWKQIINDRLEINEAFGVDDVPGHQLRPFAILAPGGLYNLARNRTFTGNVIYSPSAYLLFSLEYRRILSSFVNSPTQSSDVFGIAAGYKF